MVVGVAIVTGGDGSLIPNPFTDEPDVTVPPFELATRKVVALPTSDTSPRKLADEVEGPGAAITSTLDTLYTEAFLDPTSWREGDYDGVWTAFSEDAAAVAREDVETLTLGLTAGQAFESIEPRRGTVTIDVLLDKGDHPVAAYANVVFLATASAEDGSVTTLRSIGSFFFERVEGDWLIISYEVTRDDSTEAAASPTATASPTEAA